MGYRLNFAGTLSLVMGLEVLWSVLYSVAALERKGQPHLIDHLTPQGLVLEKHIQLYNDSSLGSSIVRIYCFVDIIKTVKFKI